MAQLSGQPVVILPEGTQRYVGRDAQRLNILAARIIAETVRTTLGPKGMDKMLVDSLGDIVVTNDGATILDKIDLQHPAAKMMVEVAKTQDKEAGDGTTTAVVIAGELLRKAEELLDQNIHPSIIIKGYALAAEKAQEILDEIAIRVDPDDEETLLKIAATSITGKNAESHKELLAKLAVEAVKQVAEKKDGKYVVDLDNIKFEKKAGEGVEESELVRGVVIDKEVVHPRMPKRVENAKIALINEALEVKKTETDAKINITSPDQLMSFLEQEEKMLKDMVDHIAQTGANVVFVQKGIDDLAQHYLAKYGIMAVRRVKKSDMEKLAKATGAKIVTNVKDLTPEDLGYAEVVEERKLAGENMIFVEGCKNPKAVTILIRGGTEHVIDEVERALEDAVKVVKDVMEDGAVLPAGGAPEIELAIRLDEYAKQVGGKEALAIENFADALKIIPKTLAENAGLDTVEMLVKVISEHKNRGLGIGIDVFEGKPADMLEKGIIEPLRVKKQAIKSASEAAIMILRIDDVIAAKATKPEGGQGGGMPGGMGGMDMGM
ncbi:chaperonin, alpha subunit [Thermococcus kodakarensis KOD1]|uniref:Chaperonin subunit alpha n=2 Tax=Thermococcus TaxID=2263 RepID=THSA_THEKO|nr:thermosome subunit beta [Thermococcus kodakarensis]P61111.1 RecName: Full=Thermosome subunit alpha; AltName: Full=Chaperonin subunit alpha; AltName: Full=Thermosome subunit 1 [Thermococcus kodakarensis KOD1]P61112.1 RecName: Full=Thermosome subunit alpha; AltName: Full=Chaperonin subunit alpha; AltName: Full=Thermosome subunit 1 [Thermococcus sp. JCM 11816]WCN28712.1 thermosome subunit beta [Thermococcus kodakarensis]WCN31010.1 thermosome subunit beta [Thermococcus kodakarensis]BAA22207.2 c